MFVYIDQLTVFFVPQLIHDINKWISDASLLPTQLPFQIVKKYIIEPFVVVVSVPQLTTLRVTQ